MTRLPFAAGSRAVAGCSMAGGADLVGSAEEHSWEGGWSDLGPKILEASVAGDLWCFQYSHSLYFVLRFKKD